MSENSSHPSRPFNYATLWRSIEQEAKREGARKLIQYMTRRDFMKFMSAGLAVAALMPGLRANAARGSASRRSLRAQTAAQTSYAETLPNGVAAGDVTQESAMLWTRSTIPGDVTFEYATDADFANVVSALSATAVDPAVPVKVLVESLDADTRYYYRVSNGTDTLTGSFRTSASAGTQRGLRFGVTGDWRGELRPYVALSNALDRELEFFVEHGDTVYLDIPSRDFTGEQAATLEEMRIKHNEVYTAYEGLNYLAGLRAAVPVLATIDDHEVTNDFSGGASPETDERFAGETVEFINQTTLYRNGMQVFQEFNPLRDEFYEGTGDTRMDGRPKLYRYNTYGSDAAVFVIDARSFRDAAVPELSNLSIFNESAREEHLRSMWAEGRTMLGHTQIEDFKRDLLAAQEARITWKFIMLPEPAQLMGWFGGSDRWEGFAPERTEIMQFIEENNILNVVFVAADVHTTFINKLTYQTEPLGDPIPMRAFEISTGSLAFYPPTGAALVDGAAQFRLLSSEDYEAYQSMSVPEKDAVLLALFNEFVNAAQGYDPMGFEGSGLNAELTQGSWIAGHTFGWTEFDIDADTQRLTITTYGVPAYDQAAIDSDPAAVLALVPEVVSVVTVDPLSE